MIVEKRLKQRVRGLLGPSVALVAAAIALSVAARACQPTPAVLSGRVVKVVDGDTIVVEGVGDVRYVGIDTPELHHPSRPVQRLAHRAAAANAALVSGRSVTLRLDVEHRDRYGRLLAYVYADATMVNAELMRRGWARPLSIAPNLAHARLFTDLYRQARSSGRGLWGPLEGGPPWGRP